jgi:hypothetical protein
LGTVILYAAGAAYRCLSEWRRKHGRTDLVVRVIA